ncbi:MAG: nuclear transport factor 2 family protein [Ferrovibrio sp.]|uniref:nuclear transport factor 2 family protein n=1 Tax=Ferrovibrio sp. TaxID=1917215 RepID=UPI00262CA045|nr:nuclear transport factor 2 family protein [Ferrovibrio sp.]MCW0235425.1 nuclear transport factor 2 family protein [Ferrovibrio sp.]
MTAPQKHTSPKQAAANKALLQWVFADLASGNGRPFLDLLAEEVVWHVEGSTAWSRSYRGKAAVKADLLKPLFEVLAGPNPLSVLRMIAEDDCVAVQARGNAVTRAGAPYCNSYCMIFRLQDGRVVEITEYADTALIERVLPYPAGVASVAG